MVQKGGKEDQRQSDGTYDPERAIVAPRFEDRNGLTVF